MRGENPDAPILRQVHLMHEELFDELRTDGSEVRPGDISENVTTGGLDLLALPTGTLLQLGNEAVIEITGLVESGSGQNRRSDDPPFTSGLPRYQNILDVGHHFAKGPNPDSCTAAKKGGSYSITSSARACAGSFGQPRFSKALNLPLRV
jgi:hypothetical protein